MSYEGYTEILCERGHYVIVDVYDTTRDVSRCSAYAHFDVVDGTTLRDGSRVEGCDAPIIWTREVDETNGLDDTNPDTLSAVSGYLGGLGWLEKFDSGGVRTVGDGIAVRFLPRYWFTPKYYADRGRTAVPPGRLVMDPKGEPHP